MMKFFKSISLGKKLGLSFGAIVAIGIVSGVFYFHQIRQLSILSDAIGNLWMPGIVKSSELEKLVTGIHEAQFEYLVANDAKSLAAAEDNLSSKLGSFHIYFKQYISSDISDEESSLASEVEKQFETVLTANDKLVTAVKNKKMEDAHKIVAVDLYEPFKKMEESLHSIGEIQYRGGMDAIALTADRFRITRMVTIASSAGSVILSLLVSFGIYFSVTRSLRAIIDQLKSCAVSAQKNSEDLNSTSNQLSENASNAASSITETAAAVEEITSMIEKTSQNAAQSRQRTEVSEQSVQQGQESATRLAHSMQDLDKGILTVDQSITTLLNSLESIVKFMLEINQKTQLTNDIVFQTKLLSFNASVEAARAGEYGKGFSVVAEEVGKLAVMSGNTSKEINEIVKESTNKVKSIISEAKSNFEKVLEENRHNVEQGNTTINEFNQVFEKVVVNVSEAAGMVNEIAAASDEQSRGIREISKAMSQLDQATQENSQSSQAVSSASTNMDAQVKNIMNVVISLEELLKGEGKASAIDSSQFAEMNEEGNVDGERSDTADGMKTPAVA